MKNLTLFDLLNDAGLYVLSKKSLIINSISSSGFVYVERFIVNDIPYRLLTKEVVKTTCYNGVIEIYVKLEEKQ
jgi:hypothetical protein